jgi:hypothetical protein
MPNQRVSSGKCGFERDVVPVPQRFEPYWTKHRVEVAVMGRGTAAEVQALSHVKPIDAIVNSLLDPFLLAEIPIPRPSVTHIYVESAIGLSGHHRGASGSFISEPHLLSVDEITKLTDMYAFLANDVFEDRVLERAVDRFILGKKRGTHHPNRINEPNWDKIVDYVMAMETLFLTDKSGRKDQELSYRFRLNGSSLIEIATGTDIRKVFHALNALYDLRSAMVHGSDEKRVLKAANKFIALTQIDKPDYQHSLGRLLLICRRIEEWIMRTFLYLRSVPKSERPFNKVNGWEELLWQGRRGT